MPSGPVAFLLHTCWKTLVTTSTSILSLSALLRGDQIEVFKILNGYVNIDRNMFFSLKKDSRTRGHEVKLVKDQCRLDIWKHSFSQRTINEWNKLSTDCVTASSVNMFKSIKYQVSAKMCKNVPLYLIYGILITQCCYYISL